MRTFLLILSCSLLICAVQALSEKCYEKVEECHTTNYQDYVACIRKRQKRSLDCDTPCDSDNCIDTCNDCDCSSCGYSACRGSCDSCCGTCCNNYNSCTNNHCCHKTCHAQCRTSSCRSSCRKTCYERIREMDEKAVVEVNNRSSVSNADNKFNVTTIIHLNNVINNTNIIDVPININNTNVNNITLYQKESEEGTNCCTVISPRQCVPQKEYPYTKCFHYRAKQCGAFCTAPIVHKEQQQICESPYPGSAPSCRQSIIYIPQPQPRCTYQSTWPYVSCGIPKSVSCAGCYSHYVDQYDRSYANCNSACYDEGFGVGPYYRQGPFFRPAYGHAPCYPCFGYGGTGGYGGYQGYGGGFGGGYPGGYPPAFYPDPDISPYGSWSPEIENSFRGANGTNNGSVDYDPLINVGPDVANAAVGDPYRVTRELEIEVDYEPRSDAQAEVKIKSPGKAEGKEYEGESSGVTAPVDDTAA